MLTDTYTPEQYTITGTVTQFSVGWPFFETTDLVVTITSPAGIDTVLTEGSGAGKYTVSAINNDYSNGCTVTTGTAYGDGYKITIERSVPYGQELDINGDFIPGEPLEQALDKLAAQNQQTKDEIGRMLTIPATDTEGLTTEFPNAETRASKIASFDADGNITVIDPVDSGTIVVDDTTIEQDGVTLQVKDAGISAAKLASDAVTTAKIADDAVTTAKIADDAVTTAKIASPTGSDTNVVTGTAGGNGALVIWNADGDAVTADVGVNGTGTLTTANSTVPTDLTVKTYVDAIGTAATFTPVLTQVGTVTISTTGSFYSKLGNLIIASYSITGLAAGVAGTSGTAIEITLPTTPSSEAAVTGNGWIYDNSGNNQWVVSCAGATGSKLKMLIDSTNGGYVGATPSFGFTEDDTIRLTVFYTE